MGLKARELPAIIQIGHTTELVSVHVLDVARFLGLDIFVLTYKINYCKHFFFSGLAKHTVQDIDLNSCTHVIYSFAVLDTSTYEMKVFDTWLDLDLKNYANFVNLKVMNPHVKFIIALGGWTDSQNNAFAYKRMFSSPDLRMNFAR